MRKRNKAGLTGLCAILFALFLFSSSVSISNTDNQQGEVQIGNQIWATQNLDVETFRNGDRIPEVKSNKEWEKAGKDKRPAWCYYKNDAGLGKKYGRMYNWYALHDPRGICPTGWHIPTVDEWITFETFLGKKAARTLLACQPDKRNPQKGFCAQAGGYRFKDGNFTGAEEFTYLSGNSEGFISDSTNAPRLFIWGKGIHFVDSITMRCGLDKEFGLYVRCVKN